MGVAILPKVITALNIPAADRPTVDSTVQIRPLFKR